MTTALAHQRAYAPGRRRDERPGHRTLERGERGRAARRRARTGRACAASPSRAPPCRRARTGAGQPADGGQRAPRGRGRPPLPRTAGSTRAAARAVTAPTGTLIRNTERQPSQLVSTRRAGRRRRAPGGADRAPDRERGRALRTVVGRGDGGQRRGKQERGAEALRGARGHEHRRRGREPAGERGRGEREQAGEKHATAAEHVGGAAAEQHQPAGEQDVGGDDPRQIARREPERLGDRRERDVHDRDVENDHELRGGHEEQDRPGLAKLG